MYTAANGFLASLQSDAFGNNQLSFSDALDLQGWLPPNFANAFNEILDSVLLSKSSPAEVIVFEVGTWKGLSAHTMASVAKSRGINLKIVCIDTWLGAPEFWTWARGMPTHDLKKDHTGFPTVYHTFINNMIVSGMSDMIYPLPLPSMQALEVLKFYNIRADVVYIDAAHEYDAVCADILGYWEMLNEHGVMFGDDFKPIDWPGVVRAVRDCAEKIPADLMLCSDIMWRLQRKPPKMMETDR